ncbi:efflux transporter outer membrane subunit [Pseudomonas sp.]|uniref:efflux transporter outer membrane subunit n=1 Tax=Pseudomonas sp. TaxID=306 RepID=UPI0028AFD3A5|nr:efflux transporter outer membrane subunit [Pseudomonas sp.]
MTFAVVASLTLSACSLGPDYAHPQGLEDTYSVHGSPDASAPLIEPDTPWWSRFSDPVLTSLIHRALHSNLDLEASRLRIEQSRSALQIADAERLPQLDASAGYQRRRSSENGLSDPSEQDGKSAFGFWEGGVKMSWELDLWGRVRRQREAARADADQALFDASGVRLALLAETAQTYIRLRGAQTMLLITQDNLSLARRGLALSRIRESDGVSTRLDVAEAAAQVASFEARLPLLEQRGERLTNALAYLLAEAPGALRDELGEPSATPHLETDVPPSLPSQLAQRRPDILRAEAALHAATARIGVARADFYPRIALSGDLGLQSMQLDEFNWNARTFGIGPQVSLPLFDGGRLRGQLQLTEARQQEAALDYRRIVLRAWHEVDNALAGYRHAQRRRDSLEEAVEQNRIAARIAQQQYAEGAVDYLNVLSVQNALLASQEALAESTSEASLALVDLYKAVGGGWANEAGTRPIHSFLLGSLEKQP